MKKSYDVFISYRRENGYDTAKHLNDLLVKDGYKVSFDLDTLRNGDFDVQLLTRIEQCTDFILIVDKHAFDRTLDPDFDPQKDWLRCELAHALKHDKNIIPVFLSDVTGFPEGLPDDVSGVVKKNGPEFNRYYFDDFYKKLRKRFLKSRSRRKVRLLLSAIIISACVITSLVCGLSNSDGEFYMDPNIPHTTNEEQFTEFVEDALDAEERQESADSTLTVDSDADELFYSGCRSFIESEFKKAVKLFERAADKGSIKAQYALGACYDNALGVKQNFEKARSYYKMAAEAGLPQAQNDYGIICSSNNYYNPQESFIWIEKSARQGYAPAQYHLAMFYFTGSGVVADVYECLYWLKKASRRGYKLATYNLASAYLQGNMELRNVEKGISMLEELVEEGFDMAQNDLGLCYSMGFGVEQDYEMAISLLEQAAAADNANSLTTLGMSYVNPPVGSGMSQDFAKAMGYLKRAADKGYPIAQYAIGEMYRNGYGVRRSRLKANKWYNKAERQGFSLQQYQQQMQKQQQMMME